MKWSKRFLLLLCLSGFSMYSKPHHDSYKILFDGEMKKIRVEAGITLEDLILTMGPYGPMPERWDDYIEILDVRTTAGDQVFVKKEGDQWILEGVRPGERIQLVYEMALTHEEIEWPGGIDGVAYVRDWGVVTSGRALFLMNGADKKDISVSVRHPEGLLISTPWTLEDPDNKTYRVSNFTQLQESFIVAGTHQEILLERGDFLLKFVLGGEGIKKKQEHFRKNAAGVMDYYIELMGGIPQPAPGLEFGLTLVIIAESGQQDGEVIGNHLSMFMNPEGDPMQQVISWFMFSHEFFHLWNGKTLRFADASTDWFKEGFSNYYTIKSLYQMGLVGEAGIFGVLDGLFYQRYINDPGFGTLAPADAASGFDKDKHWGLIYGGGLFASIALDLEIRHHTHNQKSLDDLMRGLYSKFGGSNQGIRKADILEGLHALSGIDFSEFMERHLYGTEQIPLPRYLDRAGILADTDGEHLQLSHKKEKSHLEKDIWVGFLGAK